MSTIKWTLAKYSVQHDIAAMIDVGKTTISPQNSAKRRARCITWQDAEAIASQVAKRLTETEACLNLNIPVKLWFQFKDRNGNRPKVEELLTRMRAGQIKAHLENIELAETGSGPHARADWRASHALLAMKSPERFGTQAGGQQPTAQVDTAHLAKVLALMISATSQINNGPPPQVIDVQPLQIDNTGPSDQIKPV